MIEIRKNPNGDTRTAPKGITFEQFADANDMHRQDVKAVMCELAARLQKAGEEHDYTKKSEESLFYENYVEAVNGNEDFVKSPWYQMHVKRERHHLLSHCPEDVNLIDVLEMLSDCVCAGMARSGSVRAIELEDEILQKAVKNTTDLISSMLVLKE